MSRQALIHREESGSGKFAVVIGAVAVVALTAGAAVGFSNQSTNLYAPSATAVRSSVQTSAPVARMGAQYQQATFAGAAPAQAEMAAPVFAQAGYTAAPSTFATSSIAAFIGMMMGAGAMVLARMGLKQNTPQIAAAAWSGSVYGVPTSTVEKPWTKYADELKETARKIASPGRGILAADESNKTCGARFASIGVENTEENRRAYREMLITAPGFGEHISGVIMYEETLYQKDKNGKSFVDIINEHGAVAGIKVDTGIAPLPGANDEGYTMGLDGLRERCQEYYKQGARFAKWRAVLRIDSSGLPSDRSIMANATGLAQYAAICQECGLVPIVEPEILMDGDHDIETAAAVAERVLVAVYEACATVGLLLEVVNPSESSRTYSSVWGNNRIGTGHARSMLDSPQAWSSRWNSRNSWMTMKMPKSYKVRGVYLQGRNLRSCCGNQFVTQASFHVSDDCKTWVQVADGKVFQTNVLINDNVKHFVDWGQDIDATCVKINVDYWSHHISMRAGIAALYMDGQWSPSLLQTGEDVLPSNATAAEVDAPADSGELAESDDEDNKHIDPDKFYGDGESPHTAEELEADEHQDFSHYPDGRPSQIAE